MDLKLEGINLVMQENVTNIRNRGRLVSGAGMGVTGRLLWTCLPHPHPQPYPRLHSHPIAGFSCSSLGNVILTQDQDELSVAQ